jgi:2'-5' RNA ligase superfamily
MSSLAPLSPPAGKQWVKRYNFAPGMPSSRYALVAYVKSPAGAFVEKLRRELHPDLPHLAAHLSILPPRPLQGSESAAIDVLDRLCGQEEPFEVMLGSVETFVPVTPTIFIRIEAAGQRMCELHKKLNIDGLQYCEEWPYIPHLTIAKMGAEHLARTAYETARERWDRYAGSRRILLENLTFVREESPNCWIDIAPVRLGRRLVSR